MTNPTGAEEGKGGATKGTINKNWLRRSTRKIPPKTDGTNDQEGTTRASKRKKVLPKATGLPAEVLASLKSNNLQSNVKVLSAENAKLNTENEKL